MDLGSRRSPIPVCIKEPLFEVFTSFSARREREFGSRAVGVLIAHVSVHKPARLQKLLLFSFCPVTFQFGVGRYRGKVWEAVWKTLHVAEPRLLLSQVFGLIFFFFF